MAAKLMEHKAVVEGAGAFPLDMLRYDECHPATEADVAVIQESLARGAPATRRSVTVVHYGTNARWTWTADRWASFRWRILASSARPAGQ